MLRNNSDMPKIFKKQNVIRQSPPLLYKYKVLNPWVDNIQIHVREMVCKVEIGF